ncbi:MAG: transglycosylase domain-containing protein [Actinobacteria bacterium]|nr:transglycosylase domain-containing protein [Actinomycetota bacterium]
MAGRPAAGPAPVLSRLGLALVVSVVMGVLLAGLAFPLVGGAGFVAKAGADDFLALPADLEAGPPPQRSKILAADGSLLATLYLQNRVNVALSQVPLQARQAIIAIEDSRFYAHHGVDYKGIVRAAVTNAGAGGVKQGASTLTQQYVKNALIESATDKKGQQAAKADSIDRKLQEARYAIALERRLTKDQILERYLNIAYYGHGVYGIGTAANYYFAKPVNKLNLAQAALLAGMVQNPNRFDPSSDDPEVLAATKARRDTVLARMTDLGFITPELKAKGEAIRVATDLRPVGSGCENPVVRAPHFCDFVLRELVDGPLGAALGSSRAERQRALLGGGLTIKTSLDPKIQTAAQEAVNEKVPPNDPFGAAAAINTVEPGTGHIKAMAVDRPYATGNRHTKINYATGGVQGFQAGSTFKAFVLAEAVRQGIPLGLRLYAPQKYTSKTFENVRDGETEAYTVQNAGDSEAGTFDLRAATALSVNTYFLQLEERTGLERPAALAESLGVHKVENQVSNKPLDRFPSFVLGTQGVSPLAMAGGPAAGKTGTVQESWFAWFIGYTPQLATSVWMGVPGELTPMKRVTINGQYYKQVYGGDIPASIWRQEMSAAHEGLPVQDFTQADATVVAGEQVPVPDVRGLDYDSAREILSGAGFGVRRGGYVSADYVSRGEVAYTYPARESLAPAGSTVSVYIASGRRARTVQPSPARLFVPTSPEPAVPQPSPSPKKKGRR